MSGEPHRPVSAVDAEPLPRAEDWSTHRGLVAAAVGYQWFYNGANFIAFKVGGDGLPPLMLATLRFGAAALVVLPFAMWRLRHRATTARQFAAAALIGVVMLVSGQSLSIWGTHFLPAGVASVFGSAPPLFLALFAWALFRHPLGGRQLTGVGVGFAGITLMGWSSATGGDFRIIGAVLTLVASASWALGSLLSNRLSVPEDSVVDLATQLMAATLVLTLITGASGLATGTDYAAVPANAWAALAFLVVASTLIGYALFIALNQRVSSTLANTFNYVAPVVALALSAILLHESLTWIKVTAAAIALVGVALMVSGPKRNTDVVRQGS